MEYEFRLPDVGEGVTEAEIVRWLVREGENIEEDQPVVEVQTDKAIVELPSPVSGRVLLRKWQEGNVAPVGEVLFVIGQGNNESTESVSLTIKRSKRSLATPSVRRLAKEMGIDLQQVEGTGKDGRVMEVDLHNHTNLLPSSPANIGVSIQPRTVDTTVEAESSINFKHESNEVPLSPIRRVIGERLLYSVTHKPHAIHFDELNVEGMVAWRNQLKQEGTRLTYTSILLKFVAHTLKQHSLFSAHYDEERQQIRLFDSISIGIATDTPKGLLVPVIHEIEKKNVLQLGTEVNELTELARNGKCSPEQMRGSAFTISNAGTLGGKWAVPIINPPEVAILALHPIEQRPIIQGGVVNVGWRMNVSLAFDHRVLDGADAIRFTQTLGKYTCEPRRLLEQWI